MSQLLRDRVINSQLARITRTASRSITARRGKTIHHHHDPLITPKEHHQHQRDIHTTGYLRGTAETRIGGIAGIAASHRHLPKTSSIGHPTASISTSPARRRSSSTTTTTTTMAASSSQPPAPAPASASAKDKGREQQSGIPKEDRNPAPPSSTPPSPRSAQEAQDATPCSAANESGPPPETAQEQQQPEPEQQQQQQQQHAGEAHPQALPAPPPRESAAGEAGGSSTRIEVNGDGVKLDHLGPLVVHKDGTVSRIANWAEMTDIERKNTLRILGKRNQLRLDTLRGTAEAGEES